MSQKIRWITPKSRGDTIDGDRARKDFNSQDLRDQGDVSVMERANAAVANGDIAEGRVKKFDSAESMLKSLKEQW